MKEHRNGSFKDTSFKSSRLLKNDCLFTSQILYQAPENLSNELKQVWMDNMEKEVIHREAKRVYDEITGENSNYLDYTCVKDIVNCQMLNTVLY